MATITRTYPVLKRELDDALTAMADYVESIALLGLQTMARRYPTKTVSFNSSMGRWGFYIEGEPVMEWEQTKLTGRAVKAVQLFDETCNEYGYGAIPSPVDLSISSGTLTRRTDW